jgi:hypothetical protein
MGNVLVSTDETEIYYPSDWLIEGSGATFTSIGCPTNDAYYSDEDDSALSLIYRGWAAKPWRIVQQGYVMMESTNIADVTQYFKDYTTKFQQWLEENA